MILRTIIARNVGTTQDNQVVAPGERWQAIMLLPAQLPPHPNDNTASTGADDQNQAERCVLRFSAYPDTWIPIQAGVPFYSPPAGETFVGVPHTQNQTLRFTFALYGQHDVIPLSCAPSSFAWHGATMTASSDTFPGTPLRFLCSGWEWARVSVIGDATLNPGNSGALRVQAHVSNGDADAGGELWTRRVLFNSSWPREMWVMPLHGADQVQLSVRRHVAATDVRAFVWLEFGRGAPPAFANGRRFHINQGAIGPATTVQIGCVAMQGWSTAAIRAVGAGAAGNHVITLNSVYLSDSRLTDPTSEVALTDTVVVGTSVSAFGSLAAAVAAAADCYRIDIQNTAAGASTSTNGALHLRGA